MDTAIPASPTKRFDAIIIGTGQAGPPSNLPLDHIDRVEAITPEGFDRFNWTMVSAILLYRASWNE